MFARATPLTLLALLALALAGGLSADRLTASAPPRWECGHAEVMGVAWKAAPFSGNLTTLGEPLPAGSSAIAVAGADSQARVFRLWLYDAATGGHEEAVAFADLPIEDAGPYGMFEGRLNVTGDPGLDYHDGWLKLLVAQWPGPGGGPTQLFRVNTGCTLRGG